MCLSISNLYYVYLLTAFPVKFSADSTTQHWLYYKEHSVREKNFSKPANRTLFIINVPAYCNQVVEITYDQMQLVF